MVAVDVLIDLAQLVLFTHHHPSSQHVFALTVKSFKVLDDLDGVTFASNGESSSRRVWSLHMTDWPVRKSLKLLDVLSRKQLGMNQLLISVWILAWLVSR